MFLDWLDRLRGQPTTSEVLARACADLDRREAELNQQIVEKQALSSQLNELSNQLDENIAALKQELQRLECAVKRETN